MAATRILCLNGSLRGRLGNTARVIDYVRQHTYGRANVVELCLADLEMPLSALETHLRNADALLVGSGVYWNSHGSPLQRFLEAATAWETTDIFFGKPVGVVLTMDSVGGMEVAARLSSVLNLFGCTVPPLGAVVLSRVGQAARRESPQDDVYSIRDVGMLVDNLIEAAKSTRPCYLRWPVKPTRTPGEYYRSSGTLDVDHKPWVDI